MSDNSQKDAVGITSYAPPRRVLTSAPAFVLTIALLLTAAATTYVATATQLRDRIRFAADVRQTRDTLLARFDTYTSLLRGATGLFAADNDVTRADFHAYVERLELRTRYPGVRSIGFARRVLPGDVAAALAAEKAHGETGFHFGLRSRLRRKELRLLSLSRTPKRQRRRSDSTSVPIRHAAWLWIRHEIRECRKRPGKFCYCRTKSMCGIPAS